MSTDDAVTVPGCRSRLASSSAASSSTRPRAAASPSPTRTTTASLAEVAEATAAGHRPRRRRRPPAFPAWKRLSASDRGRLLLKLADAIEADADYLAQLESLDTGHPIRDVAQPRRAAHGGHVPLLRRHRRQARRHASIPVDAGFLNYVKREPVGVVGADRAVELPAACSAAGRWGRRSRPATRSS